MKNLLIVESPAKAKKISEYLGPDWDVAASYGHIRDLPVSGINVDRKSLRPSYEVTENSKRQVALLKKLAKEADEVYLATDPDREGEAISWHLAEELRLKAPKRVTYQEVTKDKILAAVNAPRKIDSNMVSAQECRRVLDRIVGYTVSPALSNKAKKPRLSAGRVQTVAVRLVADLEKRIQDFKSQEHYKVIAKFAADSNEEGLPFDATWDNSHLLGEEEEYFKDKAMAERVATLTQFTKIDETTKRSKSSAPKPFTTSTLQQAASSKHKIGPKACMAAAQKLFEGGFITYHRTDSVALSDEATQQARDWLTANGYQAEVPTKPNKFASKANAQEAHEAIRPTDINNIKPQDLDDAEAKVYELIWRRTVASQMTAAEFDVTTYTLESDDTIDGKPQTFHVKGRVKVVPGWQRLTQDDTEEKDDDDADNDNQILPKIADGVPLDGTGEVKVLHTKPPRRYTEASLIKALEARGVGRPSTYASIIDLILNRGYVENKKIKLHATNLGMGICELLGPHYSFMEVEFTAGVESQLDEIASGNETYMNLTGKLWDSLDEETQKFISSDTATTLITPEEGAEPGTCPVCKEDSLYRAFSKKTNSHWWICSNKCEGAIYPDYEKRPLCEARPAEGYACEADGCDGTRHCRVSKKNGSLFWVCDQDDCNDIYPDVNEKPQKPLTFDCGCENNGKLRKIKGQNGFFWGCNQYEKGCSKTYPDKDGKPDFEYTPPETLPCGCKKNGRLRKINGSNGAFWGCSEYSNGCKKTYPDKDGKPDMEYVKPTEKTFGDCPKCKKGKLVERVRKSDGNSFLSCNNFPKCKHAEDKTDKHTPDTGPSETPKSASETTSIVGPFASTAKQIQAALDAGKHLILDPVLGEHSETTLTSVTTDEHGLTLKGKGVGVEISEGAGDRIKKDHKGWSFVSDDEIGRITVI